MIIVISKVVLYLYFLYGLYRKMRLGIVKFLKAETFIISVGYLILYTMRFPLDPVNYAAKLLFVALFLLADYILAENMIERVQHEKFIEKRRKRNEDIF